MPRYGGTAGVAYDRNYHQAGDTFGNVDPKALEANSDAIAYSVLTLSYDTSRVNGAQGRPVPGGTFQEDPTDRRFRVTPEQKAGGGGLSPDHGTARCRAPGVSGHPPGVGGPQRNAQATCCVVPTEWDARSWPTDRPVTSRR